MIMKVCCFTSALITIVGQSNSFNIIPKYNSHHHHLPSLNHPTNTVTRAIKESFSQYVSSSRKKDDHGRYSWPLFAMDNTNELMANKKSPQKNKTSPGEPATTLLVNQDNGARVLRSAVVKDLNGDYVPLDRPMGKNKSIVVFLRHMG